MILKVAEDIAEACLTFALCCFPAFAQESTQPPQESLPEQLKFAPDSEQWFMPLPLVIHLPGGKIARGTIAAYGAKAPVKVKLPQQPEKVELDPDLWVLSDKTSVSKQ